MVLGDSRAGWAGTLFLTSNYALSRAHHFDDMRVNAGISAAAGLVAYLSGTLLYSAFRDASRSRTESNTGSEVVSDSQRR